MRVFLTSILAGTLMTAAWAQNASTNAAPATAAKPDDSLLLVACRTGNLAQATALIDQGVSLEVKDNAGRTPLLIAAMGHPDLVKLLLARGANINAQARNGDTAISNACWAGDVASGTILIEAGADINLPNWWHHTPLMLAANRGCDPLVAALIQHHVDVNFDGPDENALSWAVSRDKLSTAKLLIDAGADLKLKSTRASNPDNPRLTLLERAAFTNDPEMIDLLLAHGADINDRDDNGNTPLIHATGGDKTAAIQCLLDKGADANAQNNPGQSALMVATLFQDTSLLQNLLNHGAQLEMKDKKGRTALIWAGSRGYAPTVRFLLDHGADINASDLKGETTLTHAGDIGCEDLVQWLKEKGAKRTDVHIIAREKPNPSLSPDRSWVMAVAAIYTQVDGRNPQMLGYGDVRFSGALQKDLKRYWKVADKGTLIKALNDLRNHQYDAMDYRAAGAKMAAMNDTDFESSAALATLMKINAKAIRADYLKWKERSGLAWDLCRYVHLVNLCYTAGYINEKEAWDFLLSVAPQIQKNFSSWQEMNDNFLDGRELWTNRRDPRFEACSKLLLNPLDPNSPWNQNPWNTDLAEPADTK